MTKQEYIDSCGVLCPNCETTNVEGGPIETEDGVALQEVRCLKCCARWIDIYKLIDCQYEGFEK